MFTVIPVPPKGDVKSVDILRDSMINVAGGSYSKMDFNWQLCLLSLIRILEIVISALAMSTVVVIWFIWQPKKCVLIYLA